MPDNKKNEVVFLGGSDAVSVTVDFVSTVDGSLRKLVSDLIAEQLDGATVPPGKYRLQAILVLHKEPE